MNSLSNDHNSAQTSHYNLKLRNSLTNKVEVIRLLKAETFRLYLCGPTVYDNVHIGNLRPSTFFDLIVRVLRRQEINYQYIQNITDVDDKIVKRAFDENKGVKAITEKFTKLYIENLQKLNILLPKFQFVTDNIGEMIEFIGKLITSKSARVESEDILFNIDGFYQEYGRLSKQVLTKLIEKNEKGETDWSKSNSKNFALWKKTSDGINWQTPWFAGRPGWHTECATIIDKVFNSQTIELHGGGKDLLFPHHENERIQYIAKNKCELSKVWIHFGFVLWQKLKMSKSLKNCFLASDFIKEHGSNTLRILLIDNRYNEDIEVSEELILQAVSKIKKIENTLKKVSLFFHLKGLERETYKSDEDEIISLILNDLKTTKVILILEKQIGFINKEFTLDNTSKETIRRMNNFLFILEIMGFDFRLTNYDNESKEMIKKWSRFLTEKNYTEADKIRGTLQKSAII